MRVRLFAALAALLATFAIATPTTAHATAQAAGCGSSFDQWVGTYTGTFYYVPWWGDPTSYDLRVTFTSVASGDLRSVSSFNDQVFQQQWKPAYASDGTFVWSVEGTYPQEYYGDELSCAGGRVSSAKGEVYAWEGPPSGWVPIGYYTMVRKA
jgi:hypothetical protein